ncbi:CD225/dispanin family protein [Draconibacterium sp.]|jgi:hypothetical protein|nr:CD225/dispanin family protein [Draconibacterium sp.]
MNEQQVQYQESPPPNYLAFAIITTIFCCQIFGIVSIVFAAMVNSKWSAGDFEGALNASKNAKLWAWIAFACGIATVLFFSLLAILGGLAAIGLGEFDPF